MKNMIMKFKNPYFIWGIIILISFVFFLFGISHESLWCDEAFSAKVVEYDFIKLLKVTTKDVHPPLYYLILKIFRLILGNSEWALRLLSVFGAVGMIGLGAGPVRRLFGDKTAYIYSAVILFTPIILIMAHEARMYTLAMFTVTASALYGLSILEENKLSYWIKFGIFVLASSYLHYYALITVFIINLFMLILILVKKRELLKNFIITAGVIILFYLPWILYFINQFKKVNNAFWINPVEVITILQIFSRPFFYKDYYPLNNIIIVTAPIVILMVLLTIIVTLILMKINNDKQQLFKSLFLFSIYIGTLLFVIVISLIIMPVLYPRYMIVCTGLMILPFCIGINYIKNSYIKLSIVIAFILLNANTIKNIYIQKFNGAFYNIEKYIKKSLNPGELIITSDCFCISPALYYFPEADHFFYVNNIEKDWDFTFDTLRSHFIKETDVNDVFTKYKSFWIIKSNVGISVDALEILKNREGWEEVIEPVYFYYPYSQVSYSVSKYAFTGDLDLNNKSGKIILKINNINKKAGMLWISLYNHDPIGNITKSYRTIFAKAEDNTMSQIIENVEYGEYAIIVVHDINNNHKIDIKSDGLSREGINIYKNNDDSEKKPDFEKLKFNFSKPEQEIKIIMEYSPSD